MRGGIMKAAVYDEFAQPLSIQTVPDPIAPEYS